MTPLQSLDVSPPRDLQDNLLIFWFSSAMTSLLFSSAGIRTSHSLCICTLNHLSFLSAGRKPRSQGVNSLRVWFSWVFPQVFFPHKFLSKPHFPMHALELHQSPPRPSFSNSEAFSPSIGSPPPALSVQSANLCKSLLANNAFFIIFWLHCIDIYDHCFLDYKGS